MISCGAYEVLPEASVNSPTSELWEEGEDSDSLRLWQAVISGRLTLERM
jgi:hypothetical protein